MYKKFQTAALGLLMALFAWTVTATAQDVSRRHHCTISDSSGATVAGAAITATEDATNLAYKAVSSSAGDFEITNLPVEPIP